MSIFFEKDIYPTMPKAMITEVVLGSTNPVKLRAVRQAFEESIKTNLDYKFVPMSVSSGVNSQPIGLEETRKGAINRMKMCQKFISSSKSAFSVGIENGLIAGKELSLFFKKPFSETHWYDVGVVAFRIFKQESQFTYVSYAEPLEIPNKEEEGMLPPDNSEGLDSKLEKYRKVIMPLVNKKEDLYNFYSKGRISREGTLCRAASSAIVKLDNVKVYGFDVPKEKFQTVITVGTFDLFHDLHKLLIKNAFNLGNNLVVYVFNKDRKKKDLQEVILKDTVQNRIENVSKYALQVCQNGKISVRRMTDKHVPQLKKAIKEFSSKGSVAVYGGEDQFSDFPEILDCCYSLGVQIVSIKRGDAGNKMCSSDIREKNSFKRIAEHYDINYENTSVKLWKSKIEGLVKAKAYLNNIAFLGFEQAEILKFDKSFPIDKRISKPVTDMQKMLLCLPGRTKCNLDRARKIFNTIEKIFEFSNRSDIDYFLLSYQENEHSTEFYIEQLQKDPYGFFSDDAMLVVKNLLMPKVASKFEVTKINNEWIIKGLRKQESLQKLKESLSQVTLWTRSRGSVIALEIENAFSECLKQLHFSQEEIKKLGKEIVVLSVSNLAPFERGRLFSTISITGVNDRKARKYIPLFANQFSKFHKTNTPCTLREISRTHLAVLAKIPKKIMTYEDASKEMLQKVISVSDPDCHYTPLYISPRIGRDNTLPNLVKTALKQMIDRKDLFVLQQFINGKKGSVLDRFHRQEFAAFRALT